jgi:RNA-directed DNA polymerase
MLLDWMAAELGLPRAYIAFLAGIASHSYKEYFVTGRSGARRIVYHPSRQLKALQRWLLRRVAGKLAVHEAAMAYEKNRGIVLNAARHRDAKFLLRMDFKEFFNSLLSSDIDEMARKAKETNRLPTTWTDEDTDLLSTLVCRFGSLTIGAPTSPKISNSLCFEMDEQFAALAFRHGVVYTRYADDLFFSTRHPNILNRVEGEVAVIVSQLRHPGHLQLNLSKTRHVSKRRRRLVTGIVITDTGLSIGRKTKRRLRSQIFKLDRLTELERRSLSGWLAYAKSVEPDFINRLILKFGASQVRSAMS